jgi:hypothetical protein
MLSFFLGSLSTRMALLALTCVLLACAPLQAAVSTWVGTGTTNNFSDAANWGGTIPANGDDLVFSAAAFPTRGAPVNDLSSLVVNAIDVYQAYTISGNAITCSIINDYNATSATISMNLNTPGSSVLTVTVTTAGATLDLSGTITGAGPVSYGGPGTKLVNAALNSPVTGITTLTLGSLHEWGSQTSSAITVSDGTLVLANDCVVGDVAISSGSTSMLSCLESAQVLSLHGSCAALTVGGGSIYQVDTRGAGAAQYSNVTASSVTLTGGTLVLDTSLYTPLPGAVMTILHTTTAATGTFAGLPEGATVSSSTSAGSTFVISYVGGAGHDVTLTAAGAAGTATATSGTATAGTATAGTATSGTATAGTATAGSTTATATGGTGTTAGTTTGAAIGTTPSSGGGFCGLGAGSVALLGLSLILVRRKA